MMMSFLLGTLHFKRYGLVNEANQVIRGIFDAARRFEAYPLPEVFAGLTREHKDVDFPALYPGEANIPHAWASRCIFHMLQTILNLRADAPHKRPCTNQTLPDWLPEIKLPHLHIGPSLMTLYFWREGKRTRWEVLDSMTNEADAIQVTDELASVLAFDQGKNNFMKE